MTDSNNSERYEETLSHLASGHVERYHTIPGIGQSLASHVGRSVTLALLLHPSPSMELIRYLAVHDNAERVCGDLPATGKLMFPGLKKVHAQAEAITSSQIHPLTRPWLLDVLDEDRHWAKAIDTLEAMLYCWDQWFLGNRHGEKLARRLESWLRENENTPYEIIQFVTWYEGNGKWEDSVS